MSRLMKWTGPGARAVPVIALMLVPLLAGCAGFGQQVTADQIIQKMRDTMKTTQTVQGTVDLSVSINKEGLKKLTANTLSSTPAAQGKGPNVDKLPDSASATIKVWRQKPDKVRIEVQDSTVPGTGGAILVYDGQKYYAYSPAENTVYTGTPDSANEGHSRWEDMLDSDSMAQELDRLISASDVSLAGSEQVAGHDAYKLQITPKPDAADRLDLPQAMRMQAGALLKDARATLWVDKQRWIPLRLEAEHPDVGRLTYTATDLQLNQPIDPARFVLQTPPGARTVDVDALKQQARPQAVTIQQARQIAAQEGWKLLEPSYLPDNATLVEVLRIKGATGAADAAGAGQSAGKGQMPGPATLFTDRSGFQLTYASPDADFTLREFHGGEAANSGSGDMSRFAVPGMKEVTVRGTTGMAYEDKTRRYVSLVWFEKAQGTLVTLDGKLALDEALKIAEGLK